MTETNFHSLLGLLLRSEAAALAAAGAQLDQNAFVEWAREQRMASWLFSQCPPELVDLKEGLHRTRLLDCARHVIRLQWAGELLDALARNGVTVYAFKGAGIAHLPEVFATPDLRPLGDLDLLVRHEQLAAAAATAESLGFAFPNNDPAVRAFEFQDFYNVGFIHPQHGLLELHQDLYRDISSELTRRWLDRACDFSIYDRPVKMLRNPDLFLCLSVHFCQSPDPVLWLWLLDLALMSKVLTGDDWREIQKDAGEFGLQVFVCTIFGCLEKVWGVRPAQLPPEVREALHATLTARERTEMAALLSRLPHGPLNGDRICMARRLSGRPVRGKHGVWSSLFCHPGAVCIERNVRSDSPFFWWHRMCHVFQRGSRGVRAVWRRK